MHRRADTYAALLREEAARQPWGKRPNRVLVAPVVVYNGPLAGDTDVGPGLDRRAVRAGGQLSLG